MAAVTTAILYATSHATSHFIRWSWGWGWKGGWSWGWGWKGVVCIRFTTEISLRHKLVENKLVSESQTQENELIIAPTTPVLFQHTPNPCKYCRNESSVLLYNTLARKALAEAARKTPATPLRINDLWQDMTNFCGSDYHACQLQLAGGVHCTQEGRQYSGLSVAFSILAALFDFGRQHPSIVPTPNNAETRIVPDVRTVVPSATEATSCGASPMPLNNTVPNLLLIGDSISMGYGFLKSSAPKCACGDKTCCSPDFRLGYGLYVQEILKNVSAGWGLMEVQHNGGWYLDGQAGDTKRGISCLDQWLGVSASAPNGLQFDIIHVNFGLHDLNGNATEVPVQEYSKNLRRIFDSLKLKQPKAKLIFYNGPGL